MTNFNCEGINCSRVATLQCPKCVSLGFKSHFCSQKCFVNNWSVHKHLHSSNNKPYDPFPTYNYTGELRAEYPLSKKRSVPDHINKPDYAIDGLPKSELALGNSTKITVLNDLEIEKARVACRLAREVLEEGAKAIKTGVSTDEIDKIIHEACIKRNCYPSPLNYHGFPKSVCTSVNEVICHGIPDQRKLKDGDICNIDVTVYYDGFHGDLNETYLVGEVSEKTKNVVKCARKCLDEAIKAVKPGMLYRDLGKIIEKCATEMNCSVVRTYCGHGINKLFHCPPNVPHYANNKAIGVIKKGHMFTIEPMICEGNWKDTHWPDQWTAVTADGKNSAQFEETLLVTDTGCDILTKKQ